MACRPQPRPRGAAEPRRPEAARRRWSRATSGSEGHRPGAGGEFEGDAPERCRRGLVRSRVATHPQESSGRRLVGGRRLTIRGLSRMTLDWPGVHEGACRGLKAGA